MKAPLFMSPRERRVAELADRLDRDGSAPDRALPHDFANDAEARTALRDIQHTIGIARSVASDPALSDLRHETLARFNAAKEQRGQRRRIFGALAASLALVLAGSGWFFADRFGQGAQPDAAQLANATMLRTVVGGSLAQAAPDGSLIRLNSASRLAYDFSARERNAHLIEGQAFFEVAHDARRAFVVRAGQNTIKALGTEFDVQIDGAETRVILVKGKVEIGNAATPGKAEAILKPGEQAVISADRIRISKLAPGTLDAMLSWREGVLEFDDVSLQDAVAEANRYRTRKILLLAPQANALRISGRFPTGRTDQLIEAIEQLHGLKIDRSKADRVMISSK